MPAGIELRSVSVGTILRDVSLTIRPGESVALIGRSGAGKTTTLRLMNGLAQPTAGAVLVDNVDLRQTNLIALRRNSGYIIQGGGLFPHRTVYENVATIPRLLRWREEDIRLAADALLETLGIHQLRDRFPRSLSGGEQQRVGIARAMIAKPSLLLCDEPFGALDPIVRRELQDVFRELRSGVTIVFVTHDLAEAMRVCERIVLMDQGRVVNDSTAVQFVQQSLPLVQQFVDAASVRA